MIAPWGKLTLINKDTFKELDSEFLLSKNIITAGRDSTNDVRLFSHDAKFVSRNQFMIIRENSLDVDSTFILDCNSSNGIFVNNIKENKITLKDGDIISIHPGKQTVLIDSQSQPSTSPEDLQSKIVSQYEKRGILLRYNLVEKKRPLDDPDAPELKRVKTDIIKGDSLTLSRGEIEQEFMCPICSSLLYECTTLQPCTHSFCKKCILNWCKTSKNCPVCRKNIIKKPLRNNLIDNILDKIAQKLSPDENRGRLEKISGEIKKENDGIQKLSVQVKKAQQTGAKFLKLDGIWGQKEKQSFKQGIDQYTGKARSMFCGLTGLTEDWIKNANNEMLQRACSNIDLVIPERSKQQAEDVKDLLRDFLNGEIYWNSYSTGY